MPPQTQTPTISPEVANHVLSHFSRHGYPGSPFTQSLIQAFAKADRENFARLSAAFPDYGAAVDMVKYDPNGITNLQRIACGGEAA